MSRHSYFAPLSAHCVNAHGFSLHAGGQSEADDRQGLEPLCRYITRPAISLDRLSINQRGQVVLKLKTAWHNGTTPYVTPYELSTLRRARALGDAPCVAGRLQRGQQVFGVGVGAGEVHHTFLFNEVTGLGQ